MTQGSGSAVALTRTLLSIDAATWAVIQASPSRATTCRLEDLSAPGGHLRAGVKQRPGSEAFMYTYASIRVARRGIPCRFVRSCAGQ